MILSVNYVHVSLTVDGLFYYILNTFLQDFVGHKIKKFVTTNYSALKMYFCAINIIYKFYNVQNIIEKKTEKSGKLYVHILIFREQKIFI